MHLGAVRVRIFPGSGLDPGRWADGYSCFVSK